MPFGSLRNIDSFGGDSTKASAAPVDLLRQQKLVTAYPLAWSGSGNVTVTLNASVTKPIPFWAGLEYKFIKKSESYTFAAGANNTILNSSGVVTASQSPATGIWYLYVGISAENTFVLYPSQTAPSYAEAGGPEAEGGILSHPGTSRTTAWVYVGFMLCTATTPTFVTMTKTADGSYLIKESEKLEQVTTDTSYAALGFTGAEALPAHDGVSVSGWLETAAGDTVKLAYDSNGGGAILATGATGDVGTAPFSRFPVNAGDLQALHGTAAGDVHITQIHDLV
jgi:hypothetical protein